MEIILFYKYIMGLIISRFISFFFNIRNENIIETKSEIKHVILLMLENRSFDQVFGYRSDYPEPYKVNGIDKNNPKYNLDIDGNKIYQKPIKCFTGHDDSSHDLEATLYSIYEDGKIPTMGGFVKANQLKLKSQDNSEHTDPIDPNEIMGYFERDSFPVYEYIADNFIVCDNWFASLPSCTLPNRAFGLCASSDGHINNRCKNNSNELCKNGNKKLIYKCDTIFDRLNEKNIPWKVYYNDVALSLLLEHQIKMENLRNYSRFENLKSDIIHNKLPAFSFIEPEYGIESSYKMVDGVANGQNIVFDVIKSLESNKEVYNNTLFVIYYDESGGFFDHVVPPSTVSPNNQNSEWTFDLLGNRVPAMLINPRLSYGVDHTLYDHTSLLSFITWNWNLMSLTYRDAIANNFASLLNNPPRNIPNIPNNLREKDPSASVTIRNRPMDVVFFKTLIESHLFELISESAELIYSANESLHNTLHNIINKFK